MMKVNLVCESFDKGSGQGIYKVAYYLRKSLRNKVRLTSKKPDILHYLNPLRQFGNEKDIVTIHDLIPFKAKDGSLLGRIKRRQILKKALDSSEHFIVPSWITYKDLLEYGIEGKQISMIHWGVDMNFFRPLHRTNTKRKVIGYVGALTKRKSVETLLSFADRFREFDFIIAGKGQEEKKLLRLMDANHLDNVKFLGFVPENNLPKFYNSIDVFIILSKYEGFSMQLLEAMSCEVPFILSTNIGIAGELPIYLPEQFEDFFTKLSSGKIKPLTNQRKYLIYNGFTWSRCSEEHLRLYKELSRGRTNVFEDD